MQEAPKPAAVAAAEPVVVAAAAEEGVPQPAATAAAEPAAGAVHVKARGAHPLYPARAAVADADVPWSKSVPGYAPTQFTHPVVRTSPLLRAAASCPPPHRGARGLKAPARPPAHCR